MQEVLKESIEESDSDKSLADKYLSEWLYIVNINSSWKEAIIHGEKSIWIWLQFDEERGDIFTESLDTAEKYKSIIENKWLDIAIEWFKSI